MRFMRWMEDRLSGRRTKNRKSKAKNTDHRTDSPVSLAAAREVTSEASTCEDRVKRDLAPSVHKTESHLTPSSPLAMTPLSRQRSRIKTNPWLRSPWLQCRQSSSSLSPSASTDSGCNDCNATAKVLPSARPALNATTDRTQACNSSSDECASTVSSSSSVFSSRSSTSSISDTNSELLSLTNLPSAMSLLSSDAIPSLPWSPCSTPSLMSTKLTNLRLDDGTASFLLRQNSVRPQRQTQRRRAIQSLSKYKSNRMEKWVPAATDELSSSDEELFLERQCDVPSPAPPDRPANNALQTFEWSLDSDSMSLDAETRVIEALIRRSFGRRDSIPVEFESNCSSLECLTGQLAAISPQADSGVGLSTSSSTTPVAEVNADDVLKRVNLWPNCESRTNANNPSVTKSRDDELSQLAHRVRSLRMELNSIVDTAVNEAREEEVKVREERLNFLKDLIEYKRLTLILNLNQLKQKFRNSHFY